MLTATDCDLCQRELPNEGSPKTHINRELKKRRKLPQAEMCHQKRNLQLTITIQSGPLASFFGSYSNFIHNPSKPSGEEFTRLRRLYRWKRGDLEGETAWSAFRSALVKEFNGLFGTDSFDLLAWQNLCMIVGIQSRHKTREECIRLLKDRYFNLVDVVDVRRRGKGVAQVFSTEEALREYTIKTASYFPHGSPKAGNLLSRLLRKNDEEIISLTNSSLPPSRYTYEQGIKVKAKAKYNTFPSSRGSQKRKMVAEQIETINAYSYVEFDSN